MDILTGKTRISRKRLQELSAGPEEDVRQTAEKIKEGTFGKEKPAPAMAHPVEKEFKRSNDAFYPVLRSAAASGDTEALRTALRSYIGVIEDMLRQI